MQNTFSQSGNDSKWFLKKSFFKIGMWHSRPPRDPPTPFMANAILNFHFDFLTTSLRQRHPQKSVGKYIVTFPGNATLVRSSQEVVKGSELTLTCLVPDLGRPKALLYKWSLGDHIVNHVTTETWTINPVTLETQVIQLFLYWLDLRSSSLASQLRSVSL